MTLDFFEHHEKKMATNPEYCLAYDELKQEFHIANALIKARTDAGLTQTDVAVRLGITQPAVARIESGKNVSLKTLQRYANAIGHEIHLDIVPL